MPNDVMKICSKLLPIKSIVGVSVAYSTSGKQVSSTHLFSIPPPMISMNDCSSIDLNSESRG